MTDHNLHNEEMEWVQSMQQLDVIFHYMRAINRCIESELTKQGLRG